MSEEYKQNSIVKVISIVVIVFSALIIVFYAFLLTNLFGSFILIPATVIIGIILSIIHYNTHKEIEKNLVYLGDKLTELESSK